MMTDYTAQLEKIINAAHTDNFNTEFNRKAVTRGVTRCLKEISKTSPVPVDFNIEINYNNNSLNIFFSKEFSSG